MKFGILLFFMTLLAVGNAQQSLNQYKYIIVPKKFEGFKKQNQYQTSTLVKYLLGTNGFTAVYDDAFPPDLYSDRCLGLSVSLENESSMFATRVVLVFKDCNAQEVYRSRTGSSKIKDFKKAYNEAITDAFGSFNGFTYAYSPKAKDTEAEPVASTQIVTKEVEPQVEEQSVPVADTTEEIAENTLVVPPPPVVRVQEEVVETSIPGVNPESVKEVWYAQETPTGYQLVDSTPSIRLRLFKTSKAEVYLCEDDQKSGILHKSAGEWTFEYYEDNILKKEVLNIKF